MKNKVSAIVAVASDYSIGYNDGSLIFHNREDLMFFSGFTQGKVCIVGYNTYVTLPNLANREIILDTRWDLLDLQGLGKDVVVIGGAKTYKKYSNQVEELFLTEFDTTSNKDGKEKVFFDIDDFNHLNLGEVITKGKGYQINRLFKG